jgi:pimeloyl-ACP methyl ester carboxylesterase
MPAGQLEASTAMVRALFDVNGHREILLHTLTMPTLVVWGARNYVLPAYQAQATVHRLPRGRLSVFPGLWAPAPRGVPGPVRRVLSEMLAEHRHTPGHTAQLHSRTSISEGSTMRAAAPNR